MEGVNFALNDQHDYARASTGEGKLRVLLVELVIEFEESFVHEHFHHFVEVTCFVQQVGPLLDLREQVFFEKKHALRSSVTVEDRKKTD